MSRSLQIGDLAVLIRPLVAEMKGVIVEVVDPPLIGADKTIPKGVIWTSTFLSDGSKSLPTWHLPECLRLLKEA